MDWRSAGTLRDVQAARAQHAAADREVRDLEQMLQEAQSFEGERDVRLRALDQRILPLGRLFSAKDSSFLNAPTEADLAERARLVAERAGVEREYADVIAARTQTYSDGVRTRHFCSVRVVDVAKRLGHARIRRGVAGDRLARLEAQLSPGELVTSGVPATEYVEHEQRVQAGRERAGVG